MWVIIFKIVLLLAIVTNTSCNNMYLYWNAVKCLIYGFGFALWKNEALNFLWELYECFILIQNKAKFDSIDCSAIPVWHSYLGSIQPNSAFMVVCSSLCPPPYEDIEAFKLMHLL